MYLLHVTIIKALKYFVYVCGLTGLVYVQIHRCMYAHMLVCMHSSYMSNIGKSDLRAIHNDCMSTKVTSLMGSINIPDKTQHDNSIASKMD